MKNLIVLAVATLFATNAVAAEMKWHGGMGWRYENTSTDDSLDTKDTTTGKDTSKDTTRSHAIHANLGVAGGWEHVEYGLSVRTQGYGTVHRNQSWQRLNQAEDLTIGLDQAYFRYLHDFGAVDFALSVGRGGLQWNADGEWQTLFGDIRPDGFGWHFQSGMFGFNAAQLVLGSTQNGGDSSYTYNDNTKDGQHFWMIYGFNPYMNWKFSDEIDAHFSVAYYKWIHNGSANNNPIGSSGASLKMDNINQWDFLAQVSLPYSLHLTADLVKASQARYTYNTVVPVGTYGGASADVDVSSTAWTLGMTYGALKKAHDFSVGYAYTSKGVGSMINNFTNEKFGVDNKGHTIKVGYALADNLNLGFRTIMLQEKERIGTDGKTYSATNSGGANQKLKTNYWELTAGVNF